MADTTNTTVQSAAAYTKKQLLSAKRYASRHDLLAALLQDGQTYTHEQVQTALDKYLKGVIQ